MNKSKMTISTEERLQRQKADNFAVASIALEGFIRSKKSDELAKKFINGEITIEQEISALNAYFSKT
jgi:hypothetical protein